MVVTIHFQTAEDFKWIEPLMQLLRQSNIKVDFKGRASAKASTKKQPETAHSPVYWLEQLAKSNAFSGIENPVEWQRQTRNDRQLSR